jgi:pimeloyl-ACP methyl ester carboxylesterase
VRVASDQEVPDPHSHRAAAPEIPPIPHWPGHLVDLAAGQVYVRCAPAAEGADPAMFVHGLGGSSTNWTDLIDLLSRPAEAASPAPAFACSAPDLPGFGHSPPPASGRYTINAHVAAVTELIERTGGGPIHLVGNSLGGAICTRVAANRPDLVRTLTLISPALPDLRPRPLPMRLAVAAVPGLGSAMLDWIAKVPAADRTDRALRDVFSDPGVVHPSRRQEEIAEVLRRDALLYANRALTLSARSIVSEYFKVGRRSLWQDAAKVRAPALILYGSHDRLVNPVMAGKAARAFHAGRVLVLAGVGHVAMMEKPDAVATEIRAFLGWAEAEDLTAGARAWQGPGVAKARAWLGPGRGNKAVHFRVPSC